MNFKNWFKKAETFIPKDDLNHIYPYNMLRSLMESPMPKPIVTFDFDDTLCSEEGIPNEAMIKLVRKYSDDGCKCYIVTARNKSHESPKWIAQNEPKRTRVKDFIEEFDLPIKQVHFTNHAPKGPLLAKLGSILHFDDHEDQIASCKEHGIKVFHPDDIASL